MHNDMKRTTSCDLDQIEGSQPQWPVRLRYHKVALGCAGDAGCCVENRVAIDCERDMEGGIGNASCWVER